MLKIKLLEAVTNGALLFSALFDFADAGLQRNIHLRSFLGSKTSDSTINFARNYAIKNERKIIRELNRAKNNNQISEQKYLELKRRLNNIIVGKD